MKYVVAIKRDARDKVQGTLADLLQGLPGVLNVSGDPGATRLLVDATEEGYAHLQRVSEGRFHIEPLIMHEPLNN